MKTLYVSQQGCYVSLHQETLRIQHQGKILATAQIPLIEQILIFGKSQITTQAIRTCLWQNIPIAYLSRLGYCYGRVLPIERGYRQLSRYQQELSLLDKLITAKNLVTAKIKNSRVLLQRQYRRNSNSNLVVSIDTLQHLLTKIPQVDNLQTLMGYEGAAAESYFSAFGEALNHPDFIFLARSRRPPGNPVNALLSFGYQVLWNHLLTLIELQGLDPYQACLHQGSERHAALASDLIEEFRAPIVDSLVLSLIHHRSINADRDFSYRDGGCYLNDTGRKQYLSSFIQRMDELLSSEDGDKQPRWDLLTQQVKQYKQFVYTPTYSYQPYLIR